MLFRPTPDFAAMLTSLPMPLIAIALCHARSFDFAIAVTMIWRRDYFRFARFRHDAVDFDAAAFMMLIFAAILAVDAAAAAADARHFSLPPPLFACLLPAPRRCRLLAPALPLHTPCRDALDAAFSRIPCQDTRDAEPCQRFLTLSQRRLYARRRDAAPSRHAYTLPMMSATLLMMFCDYRRRFHADADAAAPIFRQPPRAATSCLPPYRALPLNVAAAAPLPLFLLALATLSHDTPCRFRRRAIFDVFSPAAACFASCR